MNEIKMDPNSDQGQNVIKKDPLSEKSTQTDFDPSNGWTDRKVVQLKKKMDQLKILRYLHKQVAAHYSYLNDALSLPNITIEAIISASLFISLSEKVGEESRFWINFVLGFVALIGTILGVWIKYFKASEKMHAHSNASREYSAIYEDIDDQLSMEKDERMPGKEYLKHIKKMINQQSQNELDIDQKYWDEYFESVSKGELINLNYTLINPQSQKDETIIEIEPTLMEDSYEGDLGVITNFPSNENANENANENENTPATLTGPPHEEEDDSCDDMIRIHFNRMQASSLGKNIQYQMGRFIKH